MVFERSCVSEKANVEVLSILRADCFLPCSKTFSLLLVCISALRCNYSIVVKRHFALWIKYFCKDEKKNNWNNQQVLDPLKPGACQDRTSN